MVGEVAHPRRQRCGLRGPPPQAFSSFRAARCECLNMAITRSGRTRAAGIAARAAAACPSSGPTALPPHGRGQRAAGGRAAQARGRASPEPHTSRSEGTRNTSSGASVGAGSCRHATRSPSDASVTRATHSHRRAPARSRVRRTCPGRPAPRSAQPARPCARAQRAPTAAARQPWGRTGGCRGALVHQAASSAQSCSCRTARARTAERCSTRRSRAADTLTACAGPQAPSRLRCWATARRWRVRAERLLEQRAPLEAGQRRVGVGSGYGRTRLTVSSPSSASAASAAQPSRRQRRMSALPTSLSAPAPSAVSGVRLPAGGPQATRGSVAAFAASAPQTLPACCQPRVARECHTPGMRLTHS